MTCCLAISLPNCSLAAADTRIGLEFDGKQLNHDGPNDLNVEVAALGRTINLPFAYRKIRPVSDGWAVCAGSQASATEILNLLRSKDAILFTRARALIASDTELIERVASATGLPPAQLRETVVLAAPFGSAAHAWTLGLRHADDRTNRRADIAINWPHAVPLAERTRADAELRRVLALPSMQTSAFTYAKALAAIIDTAARHAPDVGPFIQLGQTLIRNGAKRSIYFQGRTAELLAMTEAQFEENIQID